MDFDSADEVHELLKKQLAEMVETATQDISTSHATTATTTATTFQGASVSASADVHTHAHQKHPPMLLPWTLKYQPRRSDQMCGNTESVQELKAWLAEWNIKMAKERDLFHHQSMPSRRQTKRRGRVRRRHEDSDFIDDESQHSPCSWEDEEEEEEEGGGSRGGENAITLSGPSGCGKTAAVYAIAQVE